MVEREPLIEFKDVELRFPSQLVHKGLNFSIYSGETITILGPSGSGKTMILKLIMGLIYPTSGMVRVCGISTSEVDEVELRALRTQIGMLFQGAALFDSLSVFENVAYGLKEQNKYKEDEITEIVTNKLSIVGLPGIGDKYPSQLSGGQKKRVGLARALASSPRVVLFDEPTTGLDPTAIRLIDELIIKLKESYQITGVVVTHDISSAKRVSDRWLLISEGVVLAEGAVSKLVETNEHVKKFIDGNWND